MTKWANGLLLLVVWLGLCSWPRPASASVATDGPARRTRPGVYVATDGAAVPAWAQGSVRHFGWRALEPAQGDYAFDAIDTWLAGLAQSGQRGVLGVLLRCADGSDGEDACAPAWALPFDPIDVAGKPRLNYLAPQVREQVQGLVSALAQHYANDARLSYVEIGAGFAGQMTPAATSPASQRSAELTAYQAYYTSAAWSEYVQWLVGIYEESFRTSGGASHVPLEAVMNGSFLSEAERTPVVNLALQLGVGLHDSALAASFVTGEKPAGRCAQDWRPGDMGYDDQYVNASHWLPLERNWGQVPVSFSLDRAAGKSELSLTDEENVWWSVLNALDKHASVVYADAASMQYEEAWRFFLRYAGRDAKTTPDAWIALRGDTNAWCGDAGDYEWLVHHRPDAAGDSRSIFRASQPGGRVGKTWQGAFGRSTDVTGQRPSLYFDVDDSYMYGGESIVVVEVTYWDGAPETAGSTWELFYDAATSPNESAGTVSLGGTEHWLVHSFTLLDATFRNRLADMSGQPGNDLRLTATSGTDIRFDMLRLRPVLGDEAASIAKTLTPGPASEAQSTPMPTPSASVVVTATPPLPAPPLTATLATPAPAAVETPLPTATPTVPGNDFDFSQPLKGPARVWDTYIDARHPITAFDKANTLVLRGDGSSEALLTFDLTSLPVTATVRAAWLGLNVTSRAQPLPLQAAAYGINRAWKDQEATWAKASDGTSWDAAGLVASTDRAKVPEATFALPAVGQIDVPITTLVQEWVSHPEENHGLLLQGVGDTAAEYFLASSEWRTASVRPRLRVRLAEPPAPTPTPTSAPTSTLSLPYPAAGNTGVGVTITATQPVTPSIPGEVVARIAAVRPLTDTAGGDRLNVVAYLYPLDGQVLPCQWEPVVRLWGAADQKPAQELATATRRVVSQNGRSFPQWEFLGVDRAVQGKAAQLHLYVTVDGVRTRHNVVTLGAERGTDYPKPAAPERGVSSMPAAVDASIEIVWPQNDLPIAEAERANVSVGLFQAGTRAIIAPPLATLPSVRLHWSVDDGIDQGDQAAPAGQVRLIQTPWSSYYLWDFNDIDVSIARQGGHYVNFWLEVEGVPYTSNIWSHGYGPRGQLGSPLPEASCS